MPDGIKVRTNISVKSQQTALSTSKMVGKENIIGEMTCKKGATKHCCWGLCNLDSTYADQLKEGIFVLRFVKTGRVEDNEKLAKRTGETEDINKTFVTYLW